MLAANFARTDAVFNKIQKNLTGDSFCIKTLNKMEASISANDTNPNN